MERKKSFWDKMLDFLDNLLDNSWLPIQFGEQEIKKYACKDCDYESDNVWSVLKHCKEKKHGKIKFGV